MKPDDIRQLEQAVEAALEGAIAHHYPRHVAPRTRHLMAKAAVAVLEAVDAEERRAKERGG